MSIWQGAFFYFFMAKIHCHEKMEMNNNLACTLFNHKDLFVIINVSLNEIEDENIIYNPSKISSIRTTLRIDMLE
ncbi:hypothetical protein Lsan_3634 [Legionella santicrucis]|uniref:Uncharacterized protein n=1 Tax=Legionella santicrucis TaxID=45074 RepID=A0A0W0Y8G5_9GAMM|nr:hypothetical protein Lsan_3634 [Legionella santicrucis]